MPIVYQTAVADAYRGEKRYVRLPESEHNAVLEGVAATEYQAGLDWLWSRAVEGVNAKTPRLPR